MGWAGGLRTSRSNCPEVDGPACLALGLSDLCLASWTTSGEEGGTLTSHPFSLAPLFAAPVTLCLLEGPGQKAYERRQCWYGEGLLAGTLLQAELGPAVWGGRGLRLWRVGPQALTQPPWRYGLQSRPCLHWMAWSLPTFGAQAPGLQTWPPATGYRLLRCYPRPQAAGSGGALGPGSPAPPTVFLKKVHGPWWRHRVPGDASVNCVRIKPSSAG